MVYEPFDARKRARVEDLTREEEDLLRDIARLKRGVPAAAAAAWAEAARRGVREDEEALAAVNNNNNNNNNNDDEDDDDNNNASNQGIDAQHQHQQSSSAAAAAARLLSIERLDRQDDVERAYGAAVAGLAGLKREMPAVVARMERARAAGEYVIVER